MVVKVREEMIDGEWIETDRQDRPDAKWDLIVDAIPFFRSLGGSEVKQGNKVISTRPDGMVRSIWIRE